MSAVDLKLGWCTHEAAKYAVLKWHYSRRMPKFKQVYLGVREDGKFIGCVIFGRSSTPYLGDKYRLKTTECAELTRVALMRGHRTPVSRIVSIALRLLKKKAPGLRLIVSYADANVGHAGGIYQAGNWIYVGPSAKLTQYFWRGDWRNDTSIMREFQKNPALKKACPKRSLLAKFKYLFPLDDEMRKAVEPLARPYPKKKEIQRGGSETGDTSGFHPEEGGAKPTPPLKRTPKGRTVPVRKKLAPPSRTGAGRPKRKTKAGKR